MSNPSTMTTQGYGRCRRTQNNHPHVECNTPHRKKEIPPLVLGEGEEHEENEAHTAGWGGSVGGGRKTMIGSGPLPPEAVGGGACKSCQSQPVVQESRPGCPWRVRIPDAVIINILSYKDIVELIEYNMYLYLSIYNRNMIYSWSLYNVHVQYR